MVDWWEHKRNISKGQLWIVEDIRKKYRVQISHDKAWRARELALSSIRGSLKESYSALPSYCYVLEQKNIGTNIDIVINYDNQFKYFFYVYWGISCWVSHINKACGCNWWDIFKSKVLS